MDRYILGHMLGHKDGNILGHRLGQMDAHAHSIIWNGFTFVLVSIDMLIFLIFSISFIKFIKKDSLM